VKRQEPGPKTAGTFNEGEYLKDFREIDDALEENMRAEQDKTFGETNEGDLPFSSIEQLVHQGMEADEGLKSVDDLFEADSSAEGKVPFASSGQGLQKKQFPARPTQQEAVLYRQARRSKRSRQGRKGIWRFLPHIGHRRRHWLQKNFSRLATSFVLLVAFAGFYLLRVRPQMAQAALDEMAGATRAHVEGNYEAAILFYRQFLQASPDLSLRTIQAHYYLGCCYENIGEIAKAQTEYWWVKQAYERYCERLPREHQARRRYDYSIPDVFANALYSLGELARRQREEQKAKEYFRLLLEEFPEYMFSPTVEERLSRLEARELPDSPMREAPMIQSKGQGDGADNP